MISNRSIYPHNASMDRRGALRKGLVGRLRSALRLSSDTQKRFLEKGMGYWSRHPRIVRFLKRFFAKRVFFNLLEALHYQRVGNDNAAFRTLVMAQRHTPGNGRLLQRIAHLYRQDGQYRQALFIIRLIAVPPLESSWILQLIVATEAGMYKVGSRVLNTLLQRPAARLAPHLPQINRYASFYPEHRRIIQNVRRDYRRRIETTQYHRRHKIFEAVVICLENRWMSNADRLLRTASQDGVRPNRDVMAWFQRVRRDLGTRFDVVDMALENEGCEHLASLQVRYNGRCMFLGDISDAATKMTVELFFPTPFFSPPSDEKSTYETVRKLYGIVIDLVLERPDTIVVPRIQYNWRACNALTDGRIISYHTHSESPNPRHLHIQEAPLAGYGSMDTRGFAGFSSIATDHDIIDEMVSAVSDDAINQNAKSLYHRFVDGNVSKYPQRADRTTVLPDDYVLVPLQIRTDVVTQLAFMDGLTLLNAVVAHYAHTATTVVVKRHPYCRSVSVHREMERLAKAGKIQISDESIHRLINGASRVFVVNSGTGLEALLQEKPVVTCGHCDYSYAVQTVKTPAALKALLCDPPPADVHRIRRFLYYYRWHYVVDAHDEDAIRRKLSNWMHDTT